MAALRSYSGGLLLHDGEPLSEEIRRACWQLGVEHWMRRVEFRKTVEAMYEAGARIFVEVGPGGILTAFVDDILRGRPYLAVASNVPRRSGITQLNHLVGMLASQRIPMNLEYLYKRRAPRLALPRRCRRQLDRRTEGPWYGGSGSAGRSHLARPGGVWTDRAVQPDCRSDPPDCDCPISIAG